MSITTVSADNNEQLQSQIEATQDILEKQKQQLEEQQQELRDKQDRKKNIQNLKNQYEHLKTQLVLQEKDLKLAYENYKNEANPNFLRERELEFIQNRINKLRKERLTIMQQLKKQYNIRTKTNDINYKLYQTNNEFINSQKEFIDKNDKTLEDLDIDLQLKNRKYYINEFNVNHMDRNIDIAKTVLFIILASMVPTILSILKVIPENLALVAVIALIILGTVIIILKLTKVKNRSKRIWELRNFKNPIKKLKTQQPFTKIVSEEESLEEDDSIEDILSQHLSEAERCKA